MSSFNPKKESYSTSESGDYRWACTIAHKNIGDDYLLKTLDKLSLSHEPQLSRYVDYNKKKALKCYYPRVYGGTVHNFRARRRRFAHPSK